MIEQRDKEEPVPAAVMGLLQELPPPGSVWPAKGKWLAALRAVIEVTYPEGEGKSGPVIVVKKGHRHWIKRTRRLLYGIDDGMRKPVPVWRAQVKIGTHPGSIAVFLSAPVEGQRAVLIEDIPRGQARVNKPMTVLVERIDDITERIFVGRS